jgi:hypothetical protein
MNHQSAGGPREEVKGLNFDNIGASLEFGSDASVSDSENKVRHCYALISKTLILINYSLNRMTNTMKLQSKELWSIVYFGKSKHPLEVRNSLNTPFS